MRADEREFKQLEDLIKLIPNKSELHNYETQKKFRKANNAKRKNKRK